MRRTIPGIIIIYMILFTINSCYAYTSQSEKLIKAFNTQISSMDNTKKIEYLNLINGILTEPKVVKNANSNAKILIKEVGDRTKIEINKLKGTPSLASKPSDGTNYQMIDNIDFIKVRDTRINWHNERRIAAGLEPLEYHSDLEKSAITRANYLATNNKTEGTHQRQETDGYYNYNSVKDWFNGLGIFFAKETGGKSAFSESIGYRGYKCSGGDCTQSLIDSTQKIFNSFVNEGNNGAHYKAIMMPHYKYMGLGFQVNPSNNTVFAVIHYAENIVE